MGGKVPAQFANAGCLFCLQRANLGIEAPQRLLVAFTRVFR